MSFNNQYVSLKSPGNITTHTKRLTRIIINIILRALVFISTLLTIVFLIHHQVHLYHHIITYTIIIIQALIGAAILTIDILAYKNHYINKITNTTLFICHIISILLGITHILLSSLLISKEIIKTKSTTNQNNTQVIQETTITNNKIKDKEIKNQTQNIDNNFYSGYPEIVLLLIIYYTIINITFLGIFDLMSFSLMIIPGVIINIIPILMIFSALNIEIIITNIIILIVFFIIFTAINSIYIFL